MPNKLDIWTIDSETEEKFLRNKAVDFDFAKFTRKEITELIHKMRKMMHAANGVGLAANQIGLPFKMFVAEIEGPDGPKFYAIFNPKLEKLDKEEETTEEGCLSVPGLYGEVKRSYKVLLTGQDHRGKPIKIKAWGFLARIFQHETDHLDGKLFIDRTKKTFKVEPH